MSENPTPEPAQDPKGEPAPPESKAETDWKAEARKWEERAKENKSAAERLREIEEASKTEQQKLAERAEAAEKRAQQAERSVLQVRIATEFGIPQEAVHGDDEESMRSTAQKLVEWRDSNKRTTPKPKQLRSGSSATHGDEHGRAAAALRSLRQG